MKKKRKVVVEIDKDNKRIVVGDVSVKQGKNKISLITIKRSIKVFSYICAFFILFFGIFISYKFLGISNILSIFICSFSIISFFTSKRLIHNYGVERARKKHKWLLNDLIIFKFKSKRFASISLLAIISSSVSLILLIMLIVPSIDIVVADDIILGAHRGDSVQYIENTIPAITSAIENDDYKFVEFDIQYTKDKQIVVHHDLNLIRLQHKFHYIADLDYNELLNISDYYIPLYSEVMDIVARKKPLNIEIKSQGNFDDDMEIVDFVIFDLKQRGVYDKVLLSSVSSEVVKYIGEKYPDIKTGIIYYVLFRNILNAEKEIEKLYFEMREIGADYLMLFGSNIREYDLIERLKPEDVNIVIWYFDDKMYIIPSGENGIIDKDGNIVGYTISDKQDSVLWSIVFNRKILVGKEIGWW